MALLHAPRRGAQRMVVLAAVLLFGCVMLVGPGGSGEQQAKAAAPNFPFACGASDANRQTFALSTGSGTSTSGSITPCLSGSELELTLGSGSANVASIQGMTKVQSSAVTVKDANGTAISNIWHIAFKNFTVTSDSAGTVLKTIAGTAAAGSQGAYTLTLTPGGSPRPVFGAGSDVITDMWVTGDSVVKIDLSGWSILAGTACGLAGGSGPTLLNPSTPCTVTVANLGGDLIALLAAIGADTYNLKQVDLKFYYLVTHNSSGGVPSGDALQFPNTTVAVSPNP
ncbi:hypothetical protein AB3X52_11110 [Nocardioides sp. DS6]|uniref:Uncharacterized protein n=1 Tax=Nocardioides eburneus TaxID=3231482 RepID=A0ABV3SZ04_9ACTN